MKRAISFIIIAFFLTVVAFFCSSCGTGNKDGSGTVADNETTTAKADDAMSAGVSYSLARGFTYRDASILFSDVYHGSWTHAEQLKYVADQADHMKERVAAVYDEIIAVLRGECEEVAKYREDDSPDEYFDRFVSSFQNYYNARLEMAETADDAYSGLSALETFGGNAGADCTVRWRYVYYRNLYDELCGLRDWLIS